MYRSPRERLLNYPIGPIPYHGWTGLPARRAVTRPGDASHVKHVKAGILAHGEGRNVP